MQTDRSTSWLAAVLVVALAGSGCAAAKLTGKPELKLAPDRGDTRWVVVEPFFEDTGWDEKTRVETQTVYNPYSSGNSYADVQVTQRYAEKPVYAQLQALNEEHRRVIEQIHRLRPQWQVLSTGDLPAAAGQVTLVRTVIGPGSLTGSNRPLKTLACAFGIVIWPLLLFNIAPVEETQQVTGMLQRYEADANDLRGRLIRYPTQPDFAVDTRGLTAANKPFSVEFEYAEGILAAEQARAPALIAGFSERLAGAIIGVVESAP